MSSTQVQIRKVDLIQLNPSHLSHYEPFLIPSALHFIRDVPKYPLMIGIEALKDGKLIGFALAVCEFDIKSSRLVSLFVKEEERGKGIGSNLFAFIEKELTQKDCKSVYTEFADDNPTKEALEKILSKFGWALPYVYMVCCYYDIKKFNPPWFQKNYPLPSTFQEFKWKDLTGTEREHLAHQANQWTFHPSISPFTQEETIDPVTSLGLRHKNQVIGWMVTHRLDPDTIVYSSLYLDPKFHRTVYGLRLLIDAIKLQQQSPVPYTLFKINLEQANRTWLYFVKKRLVPYAQKVQRIKWSWHRL